MSEKKKYGIRTDRIVHEYMIMMMKSNNWTCEILASLRMNCSHASGRHLIMIHGRLRINHFEIIFCLLLDLSIHFLFCVLIISGLHKLTTSRDQREMSILLFQYDISCLIILTLILFYVLYFYTFFLFNYWIDFYVILIFSKIFDFYVPDILFNLLKNCNFVLFRNWFL